MTTRKPVRKPQPRKILDVHFILADTDEDRAVLTFLASDAQTSRRTMAAEVRYMVNVAIQARNQHGSSHHVEI